MPLPNPACAIGILPNARDLRPRTIILASVAVHGTVSGPTSEIQLERGGASCLDYDFQEVQWVNELEKGGAIWRKQKGDWKQGQSRWVSNWTSSTVPLPSCPQWNLSMSSLAQAIKLRFFRKLYRHSLKFFIILRILIYAPYTISPHYIDSNAKKSKGTSRGISFTTTLVFTLGLSAFTKGRATREDPWG